MLEQLKNMILLLKYPQNYTSLERCEIIKILSDMLAISNNKFALIQSIKMPQSPNQSIEMSTLSYGFLTQDETLWEDMVKLLRISSGTFSVDLEYDVLFEIPDIDLHEERVVSRYNFLKEDVICLIRESSLMQTHEDIDDSSTYDISHAFNNTKCINKIRQMNFDQIIDLLRLWRTSEHEDLDNEIFDYCMGASLRDNYQVSSNGVLEKFDTIKWLIDTENHDMYALKDRAAGILENFRQSNNLYQEVVLKSTQYSIFDDMEFNGPVIVTNLIENRHLSSRSELCSQCINGTMLDSTKLLTFIYEDKPKDRFDNCLNYPSDYQVLLKSLEYQQDLNAISLLITNSYLTWDFVIGENFSVSMMKRFSIQSGIWGSYDSQVLKNERDFLKIYDRQMNVIRIDPNKDNDIDDDISDVNQFKNK